jgi:hypothetical protein
LSRAGSQSDPDTNAASTNKYKSFDGKYDIKRKNPRVTLGRVLLVMLGLMALILYGLFVPRASTRQVEQRVKSALPIGTSKADVEVWLASQRDIELKWYIEMMGMGRVRGIVGVIRNTGPYLGWPDEEIHITLHLTENGKLSRVKVTKQPFPL